MMTNTSLANLNKIKTSTKSVDKTDLQMDIGKVKTLLNISETTNAINDELKQSLIRNLMSCRNKR